MQPACIPHGLGRGGGPRLRQGPRRWWNLWDSVLDWLTVNVIHDYVLRTKVKVSVASFRNQGNGFVSKFGITWMSGSTK
jgi:hypothetical protein